MSKFITFLASILLAGSYVLATIPPYSRHEIYAGRWLKTNRNAAYTHSQAKDYCSALGEDLLNVVLDDIPYLWSFYDTPAWVGGWMGDDYNGACLAHLTGATVVFPCSNTFYALCSDTNVITSDGRIFKIFHEKLNHLDATLKCDQTGTPGTWHIALHVQESHFNDLDLYIRSHFNAIEQAFWLDDRKAFVQPDICQAPTCPGPLRPARIEQFPEDTLLDGVICEKVY